MAKALAIIGGLVLFVSILACVYAVIAFVVIAAINLFMTTPFVFTFWQYALIGWALAIVTGIFRRSG